jgi:hypothetical protein
MASELMLEFRGLMTVVFTKEHASVVCINVDSDRTMTGHPKHVPTFEASRFVIAAGSTPPSAAYPDFKAAWSLDRCTLQIYPLGEPPVDRKPPAMTLKHPKDLTKPPEDGAADQWQGTEWLANIREVMPTATLRPDWATAPVVQARIDLTGGEIQGMAPEVSMKNAVWSFGKLADQILTTRFVYRLKDNGHGFEVRVSDPSGNRFVYLQPNPGIAGGNVVAAVYHNPMIEPVEHAAGSNGHHHAGHGANGEHGEHEEAVPHRHGEQAAGNGTDRLPDMVHASAFYELLANAPAADRPIPKFVRFAGDREVGETIGCVPTSYFPGS